MCNGQSLGCNDDAFDAPDWESKVIVNLEAGQSVLILVDDWDDIGGSFKLNIKK